MTDHLGTELPLVVTTDAIPQAIVVYTVPPNTSGALALLLAARDLAGNTKVWRLVRTGKNVGGIVTGVGAQPAATIEQDAAATAWSASLSVSGSDLVLTVVGVVGVTITWAPLVQTLILVAS